MKKQETKERNWKGLTYYLLEFLLVVAGVFLGLFLDKLTEQQNHLKLAQLSRANFITEIINNREELARCQTVYQQSSDTLSLALHARGSFSMNNLSFQIPKLTTASWETAMATEGVIYMKNTEVLRLSTCYELQNFVKSNYCNFLDLVASRPLIEKLTNPSTTRAEMIGELTLLLIYENNLISLNQEMLEKYDETLACLKSGSE